MWEQTRSQGIVLPASQPASSGTIDPMQKQKQTSNHIIDGVLCSFFVFYLHMIWCCICVGEHNSVLVVFLFTGHEHGWFRVRIGHDEVLVVWVLRFSLGVVYVRVNVVFRIGCLLLTLSSPLHHPVFVICIRGVYCVGMSTVSPVRPPSRLFTSYTMTAGTLWNEPWHTNKRKLLLLVISDL